MSNRKHHVAISHREHHSVPSSRRTQLDESQTKETEVALHGMIAREANSKGASNPIDAIEIAKTALRIAIEQKGLDVRGIDMRGISDVADYFVISSGTSERHVKGIADKIKLAVPERPNDLNGYDSGEWILLDYGTVIVHIFYEPTRQYYAFDELWQRAETIELDPELEQAARKLRTGLIRQ